MKKMKRYEGQDNGVHGQLQQQPEVQGAELKRVAGARPGASLVLRGGGWQRSRRLTRVLVKVVGPEDRGKGL